jgi:uncharacterized protein YuzE
VSKSRIEIEYDRDSDVLYLTTPENAPAVAQEDEVGMVWRYDAKSGTLVGLTLIEFEGHWASRVAHVADEMAKRFHMTKRAALALLESVA